MQKVGLFKPFALIEKIACAVIWEMYIYQKSETFLGEKLTPHDFQKHPSSLIVWMNFSPNFHKALVPGNTRKSTQGCAILAPDYFLAVLEGPR